MVAAPGLLAQIDAQEKDLQFDIRVWGQVFATDAGYDPRRYAASGGAFPLRVRGSLVGVIGVSGLPEDEDHALAVRAVRSVLADG